jgi:hypothetical protein
MAKVRRIGILRKAEFVEAEHPRAEDGKFGEKGGAAAGGGAVTEANPGRRGPSADGLLLSEEYKKKAIEDAKSPRDDPAYLRGIRDKTNERATTAIAESIGALGGAKERLGEDADPGRDVDSLDDLQWADNDIRVKTKQTIAGKLGSESGLGDYQASEIVAQWAGSSNDEDINSLNLQESISQEFGVELSDWQKGKLSQFDQYKEMEKPEVKEAKIKEYFDKADEFVSKFNQKIDDYKKQNPNMDRREAAGEVIYGEGTEDISMGIDGDIFFKDSEYSSPGRALEFSFMNDPEKGIKDFRDTITRKIQSYKYIPPETKFSKDQGRAAVKAMYSITQDHFKKMGFEAEDEITLFRGTRATIPSASLGNPVTVHGNAAESWSLSPTVAANFGGTVLMTKVKVKDILSTCATGFGCVNEAEVVILGGYEYSALVVRHKNG